jgi:hypothetical protein
MHYVLHDIVNGDLIRVSEEPFKSADVAIGQAVEHFKEGLPDPDNFRWDPKNLMWRKR